MRRSSWRTTAVSVERAALRWRGCAGAAAHIAVVHHDHRRFERHREGRVRAHLARHLLLHVVRPEACGSNAAKAPLTLLSRSSARSRAAQRRPRRRVPRHQGRQRGRCPERSWAAASPCWPAVLERERAADGGEGEEVLAPRRHARRRAQRRDSAGTQQQGRDSMRDGHFVDRRLLEGVSYLCCTLRGSGWHGRAALGCQLAHDHARHGPHAGPCRTPTTTWRPGECSGMPPHNSVSVRVC